MDALTKEEFLLQKEAHMAEIENGALFVYPTDTIYGLGCDATNEIAVYKLRNAKRTPTRPLSVIAPNKKWIIDNFEVNDKVQEWIDKIPGPYTLILKKKNDNAVSKNITDSDNVGIRIPNHWIKDFVSELEKPIVTTSANISGKRFMTHIDELDDNLRREITFFVDEGEIIGKPSNIIFLNENKVLVKER